MTENNPLVSVIVRTKDRPKLLKRALQSIAAQTYRPIEVVLVNDGDELSDIKSLEENLNDIVLKYLNNSYSGRTKAANLGLSNSDGKFVCFLDDDDIFYDDHISTLALFLKSSDYKVAYTESFFVHSEYDPASNENIQTKKYPAPTMDFSREALIFFNYIPFMCLMFERDVIELAGGLDEEFGLCEDWDLTIRVSRKSPFYHIKKITSEYNIWSRDLQSIQNDEKLLVYRKKIYQKHLNEINPDSIAEVVFNGYWINLKYIEDKITVLEKGIANKQEENRAIRDESQAIRDENQNLKIENNKLAESVTQLEDYIRVNTVRVPKNLKKILNYLTIN